MWGWTSLQRLAQDMRFALRLMGRSKGFTAVAILSLALGIGANTAMFSITDALMLRMLPVRNPEQLVILSETSDQNLLGANFQYPAFRKFRDLTQVFSDVTAVCLLRRSNVIVNGPGGGLDPGTVGVGLVSGTYFSTLGASAAIGRTFTPDDDRVPGGHAVTVISYRYWERRFGLAPDVIGRTLTLNATTYTILGVTAPGFSGDWIGEPTSLWIPIAMQSQVMLERPGLLDNPNPPWVRVIARVKSGMTIAQAQAAAQVLNRQILRDLAGEHPTPEAMREIAKLRLNLDPAARGFSPQRTSFQQPLILLLTVVGLVLLIACANIANLLLARSTARQREIAVRLALGAGPGRILRQLLTESLLLATLGGALGMLVAVWGTNALLKILSTGPFSPVGCAICGSLYVDVHPDWRILAFTAALCMLTGLLFGLAPAVRASRLSLSPALKGNAAGSPGRFGLGKALVVSQVALSIVLLIGAGLFVRTLRNLKSQDMGFDRDHVLLIWTAPNHIGRQGAALGNFYETVQQRIASVPGVVSASPSAFGLMGSDGGGSPVRVLGYRPRPDEDRFVRWSLVAPRFFSTVGMRLELGRDFTERDTETAPRVAIVNDSFARHYFPDQNPIGKRFGMRRDTGNEIEIVGLVRDAKYNTTRDKNTKMIYIPFRQDLGHLYTMRLAVRTDHESPALTTRIRDELRSLDRNLPILGIESIEQQLNQSLAQERLIATLSGFFGAVALLLASMGLYGVMSYTVARRTNEIGIRLALGATRAGVLGMVLRESVWLAGLGIAIGVPATLAATRLISAMLFGVSASDPWTVGAAAVLLIVVAALASFVPARRASKVDPLMALRYE
jgi:predicted permease